MNIPIALAPKTGLGLKPEMVLKRRLGLIRGPGLKTGLELEQR